MKYLAFGILISLSLRCAMGADQQIGQTYQVLEMDPVALIRSRSVNFDYAAYQKNKVERSIQALRSNTLPRNDKAEINYHKVMHTVEREIVDAQGNVIYPKGFQYNVLDYVKWDFRVFVLDEQDIEQFASDIEPTDVVLINEGRIFEAQKALKMPVYVIDSNTQSALKVDSVPSIVSQSGNQLKVEAIYHE